MFLLKNIIFTSPNILKMDIFINMIMPLHRRAVTPVYICIWCLVTGTVTPVYPGQCILASGMDRTQDTSIGSPSCCHQANQPRKLFRACEAQVHCIYRLDCSSNMMSPCALLEWRNRLRWICDVIRHNFKWNICDGMKQKDLKEW